MVKRTVLLVFLAAVGLLPAAGSASPPIDAAALAEDCNKDGLVEIVGQLRVDGGSGVLLRDCFISMLRKPRSSLRTSRSPVETWRS
jgi:hypothetical protein